MDLDSKFQKIRPLMHLFLSNDAPSNHELTQLTTLLRETEAELGPLATQLNMKKDRLLLYDPIQSLFISIKSIMSPIRRLPVNVLSEIFFQCLHNFNGRPWNTLQLQEEPWTLARVCKKWRKVALGDQRLWASVDLGVGLGFKHLVDDSDRCRAIAKLKTCLARSGNRLLAVQDRHRSPLLQQFSPYSERLEYLEFWPDRRSLGFLERIKGRLPELRELLIYITCSTPDLLKELQLSAPFDFIEDAPKLRAVNVFLEIPADYELENELENELTLRIDPFQFKLPWHQLTRLRLEADCLDLLNYCPQLVDFTFSPPIYDLSDLRQFIDHHPVVVYPNIQNLTIIAVALLDLFVVPSLEYLETGCFPIWDNIWEVVRSFVSRSRCKLKTLNLSGAGKQGWPDLKEIKKDFPDLLRVVVSKRDINLNGTTGWRLVEEDGGLLVYESVP